MGIVYYRQVAGDDSLSVHPFPIERCMRRMPHDARRRPDRVEMALVWGLMLTTAVQIVLCALSWIG